MRKQINLQTGIGLLIVAMAVLCTACGGDVQKEPVTLVYASGDYTRINPAMDEHGEINLLLFDGLTAHDGNNEVVPALAKSWEFDEASCTYTFHLEEGVRWHDGEPFTAEDVKFTIEAVMYPENGAENAPNYEDVQEIRTGEYTGNKNRICTNKAKRKGSGEAGTMNVVPLNNLKQQIGFKQ